MEVSSPNDSDSSSPSSNNVKALVSFYSNYLYNRLRTFIPISISLRDSFLSRIANFYGSSKRRRRKTRLPLPLPSAADSPDGAYAITFEAGRIFEVLEDIIEHTLRNLHNIQKNLEFWKLTAESSDASKAYFMICQRGPFAFFNGTLQMIRDFVTDGASVQKKLYCSAYSHISERISILNSLRYFLATFLAKVYMELDKVGQDLVKDLKNSLPSLLVAINDLFLKLEASIGHFHANRQSGSSVDGSYSVPLIFAKLPEVNREGSQWTDCEIKDAINLIYENLHRLDSYLSVILAKHRKPRKVTFYWMRYSCGALGISVGSLWLIRHSKLMGSSDIDNWISMAKDSTISFWNDHVEQPILAIRDELFETFRKRQKGAMELEQMQLTANSLRRMLVTFCEQTVGKKFPENASDRELFEMLEIVMTRYEKEIVHPIQGAIGGELVRALLIQVQKLKLDIDEAMLELDRILRANQINFAFLAALPAIFLPLILVFARTWFKQDTRAEGRGRVARTQRRMLVVEIEDTIMEYQICKDEGLENDAEFKYGLVLCLLDALNCAVEGHGEATIECQRLSRDIISLAKPNLQTKYKLRITRRMLQAYDSLLPSSQRKDESFSFKG